MKSHRWVFGLLCCGVFGCTQNVASTDVRTSEIFPEIEAVADGSGRTRVEVRLKIGGEDSNRHLELAGEDRLEATAGGVTRRLGASSSLRYTASFDVDGAGTEIAVAFLRGEAEESAPRSVAVLPPPFELALDVAEASRTLSAVPFRWSPSTDDGDLYWYLEGPCVLDRDGFTSDDGMHALSADEVESLPVDANETCPVELRLERSREGSVDPAFSAGGASFGRQRRTQTFLSTP